MQPAVKIGPGVLGEDIAVAGQPAIDRHNGDALLAVVVMLVVLTTGKSDPKATLIIDTGNSDN